MSWRPSCSYFVVAAVAFLLAACSVVLRSWGGPMLFAFVTVCVVFLVVGAIEVKKEDLARIGAADQDRRPGRGGGGGAGRG